MNYPKNRKPKEPIYTEEERKERRKQDSRKYNKKHPKQIREKRTRYILNNYEKYMWSVAKQSSKKRGIPFNIQPEDIHIPTHCPYIGWEITKIIGEYRGKIPTNASLDRIDSSIGYTKENIQVISSLANKLKNNADEDVLIKFALGVLKVHKKS